VRGHAHQFPARLGNIHELRGHRNGALIDLGLLYIFTV
jgi:hypothetical protein